MEVPPEACLQLSVTIMSRLVGKVTFLHMSNGIFMRTRQKQERATFVLKHYETRYTPVKRDRIKIPRNAQHPERDQNKIGTRYEFA